MSEHPSIDRMVIYGMAWHRLPSGLWAPSDRRPRRRVHLALDGDVEGKGAVAVLSRLPDSFDQMGMFVDERALGLRTSDLAALSRAAQLVGFENGALLVARLGIWIDELSFDKAAQLDFARRLFSEQVAMRIAEFLRPHERAVVLAEQHLMALARLLVLCAGPAPLAPELSDREAIVLERMLLGMSALSERSAERGVADPADWLPFLVQNGAYNSKEPLLEAFSRVTAFIELASSDEARARHDFCDLDAWAREDTGICVEHQMAAGMALLGSSDAFRAGPPASSTALLLPDYFSTLAGRLNLGAEGATDLQALVSAPRLWFTDEFGRLEAELELDRESAASGYNRTPFESRPFLRLQDGRYMLWSPRALISWVTDGFYYRGLDSARARGRRSQFHTFWGFLVERYAVEVLEAVLPTPRPLGSGRVHRESEYGRRRRKGQLSPDAALEFGQDLVFVEVCSSRLTLHARVSGHAEKIRSDITKMVGAKARELGDRIRDYHDGRFEVEGVERKLLRRVWPVIVTGPGLLMNEMLWDAVMSEIGASLDQPLVQPLTVLDLADLEQLSGLVEAGWSIPQLLERKTGAYRALDWRRMVREDPHLPEVRARHVRERYERTCRTMIANFGWDPSEFDDRFGDVA